MTDAVNDDLYERTRALLEPGDIELDAVVVHTDITTDEEPSLHEATIEIGDLVAEHAGVEPTDTYVYSGNDDPDFGLNQHQGLTVAGDEFVWECQQLAREGTYEVVFYYEKHGRQDDLVAAVEDLGFDAVSVEG